MEHVFRLKRGQDLKKEIIKYATEKNISAGIVVCCVGCVYEANIRLANGVDNLYKVEPFEIVSITGTVSPDGVHIHISLSDINGNTIGGHLNDGCLVNTTAEICILELGQYKFKRTFAEDTGYNELYVEKV